MRNLDESNQNILFPKIRVPFFYFLKKGRGDVPPLVARLYWSDDNTKTFNARLLCASTAKMDNNYSASKLTSFFSFALVIVCSDSLFT